MNFLNMLNEMETKDPEAYEGVGDRRKALKDFGSLSVKVALTALPFALGSLFQKAYGNPPTTTTVLDVLNFALTLEYIESNFYIQGLASSGLIPSGQQQQDITTISAHEAEHVAFLTSVIKSAGGTPVSKPAFDFTAGGGSGNGPFKDVFSNYQTFLAVAQAFEDTGVRAYKGQAPALVQGGAYLTAALNIHSVEARHASQIRQMRYANGFADVKPWITLNESGIGAVVDANYAGEQNTVQAGIQIVGINGFAISADAASEAFDEPLTTAQVLAIVKPFLA
jgi:ferritin-like protein